jgi:hypothetical protein
MACEHVTTNHGTNYNMDCGREEPYPISHPQVQQVGSDLDCVNMQGAFFFDTNDWLTAK